MEPTAAGPTGAGTLAGMFVRHEIENGIMILRSRHLMDLGIPHAFTTRRGGVSSPPFDTLNLAPAPENPAPVLESPGPGTSAPASPALASLTAKGSASSDHPSNPPRNLARLLQALGWTAMAPVTTSQVHGGEVFVAETMPDTVPRADAIVTDRPGLLPMVRVADCVPLLLADRCGRAVAAVHAGWRGVLAGIIEHSVRAVARRAGVEPASLVAAVGPCIGVDAFEVGEEVAAPFEQRFGRAVVQRDDAVATAVAVPGERADRRPHLDLGGAVVAALREAGVDAGGIDRCDLCTHAEAELFFSHRRDHGRTGRQAALIAPRGSVGGGVAQP